jgi:pyruvate carboxylase
LPFLTCIFSGVRPADTWIITEADEAYVIGKRGQYTPVGAYLAGDEIIKIALEHGAQMIHPGRLCGALNRRTGADAS